MFFLFGLSAGGAGEPLGEPAHPEYPMGCQTQLCQYQTDTRDTLLGHDGGIFPGVWVVRLPSSDLDLAPSPVPCPTTFTRPIPLRLGLLGKRFRYLCRFGPGSFGLFRAGFHRCPRQPRDRAKWVVFWQRGNPELVLITPAAIPPSLQLPEQLVRDQYVDVPANRPIADAHDLRELAMGYLRDAVSGLTVEHHP